MEIERKKSLQKKLKEELELLAKRPLDDATAFEAYFNLSGFLKVLNRMKKEAVSYGKV